MSLTGNKIGSDCAGNLSQTAFFFWPHIRVGYRYNHFIRPAQQSPNRINLYFNSDRWALSLQPGCCRGCEWDFVSCSEASPRVIAVCDLQPCVDTLSNPVALDIDAKSLLSRPKSERDQMWPHESGARASTSHRTWRSVSSSDERRVAVLRWLHSCSILVFVNIVNTHWLLQGKRPDFSLMIWFLHQLHHHHHHPHRDHEVCRWVAANVIFSHVRCSLSTVFQP